MEERFLKEQKIEETTELEKEKQLILNIIRTREELKKANHNFEFAEFDLVDYYVYQIKANQAKLDYLIKMAKTKGINVDMIKARTFQFLEEQEDVV